jgi:lysophospholipase L1-like esterase
MTSATHTRNWFGIAAVSTFCLIGAPIQALAQPLGLLGAIGDSLTDEYAEETYDYARNWTMLVVDERNVDMGPTALQAGRPGGTWGEPRRTGYQANFARYGADSIDALTTGQHTGVASLVGSGGVTHVVVAIGANDFAPTSDAYFNIYFNLWSASRITNYVNASIANIENTVTTLRQAGAEVVLCNVLDFGMVPASRQFFGNAGNRQRVANAVARVNQGIARIADEQDVVLVDLAAMGTTILGTHASIRQTLVIGGVTIGVTRRDTASNTDPLAGFVDDGAHPHTTLQGAFANLMMTALNVGWGTGFTMFTDREILEAAGIAYGGSETLSAAIGPYESYVRSFVCRPDFNRDGFLDFFDYDEFVAGFEVGSPTCDFNRDGFLDFFDYDDFVFAYETGC